MSSAIFLLPSSLASRSLELVTAKNPRMTRNMKDARITNSVADWDFDGILYGLKAHGIFSRCLYLEFFKALLRQFRNQADIVIAVGARCSEVYIGKKYNFRSPVWGCYVKDELIAVYDQYVKNSVRHIQLKGCPGAFSGIKDSLRSVYDASAELGYLRVCYL